MSPAPAERLFAPDELDDSTETCGGRAAVLTVGHGGRSIDELVAMLGAAGARTVVDVRRFPSSRRHPHFDQARLAASLGAAAIGYRHAVELGGKLAGEPGASAFACLGFPAFASYAARMRTAAWQAALAAALTAPMPCLLCAETDWRRCHRRLIGDLLVARGRLVVHLLGPGRCQAHLLAGDAESRGGVLHLCGTPVA